MCRCPCCHRNDAGSNRQRKSYIRANIKRSPEGGNLPAMSKKQTRKLRRVREKRVWSRERNMD